MLAQQPWQPCPDRLYLVWMTKKLYIIEPTFDASTVLPSSTLLTSISHAMTKDEYHTSVADLSTNDIISAAKLFDQVELIDHGFDKNSSTWFETKIVLNYLCHRYTVLNYHCDLPLTFTDHLGITNKDNKNKLWIFGCSHSHGVGLDDLDQRFGHLVAKHFDMPANFVTRPGSSVQWSLRHLINADISAPDVVIWQLTTPHRLTLYDHTPNEILLATSNNRCLIDVFNDQQMFFHQCSLIDYGVKYLRAKNIKFVMTSILNQQTLFYNYLEEYSKYPEYCYTPECNLDLGTDRQHLGPLSHRAIAFRLVDHIQCLYEPFQKSSNLH